MTDFDFNLLGQTEPLKKSCYGICFSNGLLYSCDTDNSSIQIHECDLTLKETFQLFLAPWYIQVIDNMACIRHMSAVMGFYNLPD